MGVGPRLRRTASPSELMADRGKGKRKLRIQTRRAQAVHSSSLERAETVCPTAASTERAKPEQVLAGTVAQGPIQAIKLITRARRKWRRKSKVLAARAMRQQRLVTTSEMLAASITPLRVGDAKQFEIRNHRAAKGRFGLEQDASLSGWVVNARALSTTAAACRAVQRSAAARSNEQRRKRES